MKKLVAVILCVSVIAGFSLPQLAYADTVAFDASSSGSVGGASSFSFNHTMGAGANGILVCFTQQDATGGSKVTGVTFNSVAMTQIGTGVAGPSGTNGYTLAWYLVAPSSGTHSVTVSASASSNYYAICESFTGASQTGQPDASAYAANGSTANHTGTVTTVADNSWVVQFTRTQGQTLAAGTNCTYRANTEPFATIKSCDSNAAVTPAGSYSVTQTSTADSDAIATVSISPATAAVAASATSILGLVRAFWIW